MKLRSYLVSFGLLLGMIILPTYALAASTSDIICGDLSKQNQEISEQCKNADSSLLETLLERVAKPLFFVAGAGAVVMVVVGGFRLVVSGGSPDAVKSARGTITAALIGLAITILAYALVNYVIDKLA